MKIRNTLSVSLICLLTVVFCVIGLVACDSEEQPCSHVWGEWSVTKEATCAGAGTQERKCSECGEIETSAVAALAHDWSEATCTSPKTCKNCSATEGEALPHTYAVEEVKDGALKSLATCANAAVYYKSCACGAVSTSDSDTFTSGQPLDHGDTDHDHACDGGCGKTDMGVHGDENKDHACDYGCSVAIGKCEDADKDHACDYGCKKPCGEHSDGDDKDHLCDYGCGKLADESCYDKVVDGKCDECGADIDHTCTDEGRDHACDICSKPVGDHTDENRDHVCDYGCGEAIGECVDKNSDHACDHGCDKTFGVCEDTNSDHVCDYGCEKVHGEHFDSAEDSDHDCDYGCGAIMNECSDKAQDGNHVCDVCGAENITDHAYSEATCGAPATCSECGATTGSTLDHTDGNYDHICDGGCGKNDIGAHGDSDTDKDHVCDYGCGASFGGCSDAENDDDHACDICGEENVTSHVYVEKTELATEATCHGAATKTYICNCGHDYVEILDDALGHDITDAKAEERHVSGCEYVLVYVCQRKGCGEEVLGETVYKHKYVATIKTPATCSTDGEKTFRCSACGDTSKAPEVIEADETGHNWNTDGEVVDGIRTDSCTVCHETKTVTVYTGNKTDEITAGDLADTELELNDANMSFDSGVLDTIGDRNVTVSADKLEGEDRKGLGLSDGELAQVGDSPIYSFTINNGDISKFGDENYVTITLPYTLEEGEDVDSIAVWFINKEGELESFPATYNNGYVTFKTNHFSYYTVTRLTPAERCAVYGHGYAEQVVEGSCTKDGYVLLVCVRCHDKKIKDGTFVKADGHDYSVETHDATCTENGYVLHTCGDCDYSYKTKIDADGHDWQVEDSKEASCESDGYKKYGCTKCEAEYTVTYAKLDHVYTDTVVPATCESDGYTLHDCDNCDYSYTDSYVEALGHGYTVGEWTWESNGNKAFLNLVCTKDGEHVISIRADMDKVVTKGECSNYVIRTHTATVEYEGVTYTDVMVIRQGNPEHSFSTEWSTDEAGHWHECICGARSDEAEHSFDRTEITKAPTCIEKGESISYCVCGKTVITELPATGEHNYVDGKCETCGKEYKECDHTELHEESIDFGELGACDFTLYYDTCDCGEVKIINTKKTGALPCRPDGDPEAEEFVDENGNPGMRAKMICALCGLEIDIVMTRIEEGCTSTHRSVYTFTMNGEVIVENILELQSNTWHDNEKTVTVDLSEYGACGGTVVLRQCTDCGEILSMVKLNALCDIDLMSEPEPEVVVGDDGITHYIYRAGCSECELELVSDVWTVELSMCESIMNRSLTLRCGDEVIFETFYEDYEDSHEYETEYKLNGNSCEDGVEVIKRCTVCGQSYYYTTNGHADVEYDAVIDLSEHTDCGGTMNVDICRVCGCVTEINDTDVKCILSNGVKEDILDGDGNVIGSRYILTCENCALSFINTEWVESSSLCEHSKCEGAQIMKGDECIFVYEERWNYTDHQYEYTIENESGSCEDEYFITAHCTVCGDTDEWWSSGHRYEDFEMDLSELGGCAGTVRGERCAICGKIDSVYDTDIGCDLEGTGEFEEIVGEDGVVHRVSRQVCPDCGLMFISDTWPDSDSPCEVSYSALQQICLGDDVILEYTYGFGYEKHDYEYEYEMSGDDCEDGYTVTMVCKVCGKYGESYGSGHRYENREIDLGELGLCPGSRIEEGYCVLCGKVGYSESHDECWWEFKCENEDGASVYKCERCGAERITFSHESEKDENCQYEHTIVNIYLVNGEEVYRAERAYTYIEHNYDYEFIMNGTSCTDGFTAIRTCKDCGQNSEDSYFEHRCYNVFTQENGCDEHSFSVSVCPCGYEYDLNFNSYEFDYDDDLGRFVCDHCDTSVIFDFTNEENGCTLIQSLELAVYYGNEEVYRIERETSCDNHRFHNVEVSQGGDNICVTSACAKCGEKRSTEMLIAELEDHEDYDCYYDFRFTPSETGKYVIAALSDGDTYVTLYKIVAGRMIEIGRNDDGGDYSGQFKLTTALNAGTEYVYRIGYYGYNEGNTVYFSFEKESDSDNRCYHDSRFDFSALPDGAQTCEDGALFGSVCKACGCVGDVCIDYEHTVALKEEIDLKSYGACDGKLRIYSCACGKAQSTDWHDLCYDDWTSNEYYDEEGRLIQVSVRTCSNCGLRYTRSSYSVRDPETCTRTYYITEVVNIGSTLIAENQYTTTETSHDLEYSGELTNGAGSSCEDGVTIYERCRDCDYEHSYNTHYHETYEQERIELSELGNVCGGYAVLYGCACGEYGSLDLDHSLCEWGDAWCDLWIEDALRDGQYNINGWNSIYWDSGIMTCAVTDPADAACAYKIRYARYWLKDENACKAYEYEIWQFGYNEKTGECVHEVNYKTGNSKTYHDYVDGSTENCIKYDCPDCGSYYYDNSYYNDKGIRIKVERYILNTVDDGRGRYYERVREWAFDETYRTYYMNREYEKHIYSDGTESWVEDLISIYEGSFGDSGRKGISTYGDADGEIGRSEYAYVSYKSYQYYIYEYVTEGDTWHKYDYYYTFTDGCKRRTVYSDSDGESSDETEDYCMSHRYVTIKEPTCTQDGLECRECAICGKQGEPYATEAHDHNWVELVNDWYYCYTCGLENANGVSGDIIMEDLTEAYGNGENYVVGYYARNGVEFTKYVSLILADGTEVAIWSGIEFAEVDGIRAYAFSKAAVETWAAENGYADEEYDVRFSFVPVGSDGSFDYGVTFAEPTVASDTVTGKVSFVDYVSREGKRYTVAPTEDGEWVFISFATNDTYVVLYDADGNELAYDDYGSGDGYNNFKLVYELEAGKIYTVEVGFYSGSYAGDIPMLFGPAPTEE